MISNQQNVSVQDSFIKKCEQFKNEKQESLKKITIQGCSKDIVDIVTKLLKKVDEHVEDVKGEIVQIDTKKEKMDSEIKHLESEIERTPRFLQVRKKQDSDDKNNEKSDMQDQQFESWDGLSILKVALLVCFALFFATTEMLSISYLLQNYVPGFESSNAYANFQRILVGFIVFGINIGLEVAFDSSSQRVKAVTKAFAIFFAIAGLLGFLGSFILEVTLINAMKSSDAFAINTNSYSDIVQVSRMCVLFLASFGSAYIMMGKIFEIFKQKGKGKLNQNHVFINLNNEIQKHEIFSQKIIEYRRQFKKLIDQFVDLRKGIIEKGKEIISKEAIENFERSIQQANLAVQHLSSIKQYHSYYRK